jgi:hypothetical protein
MMRDIAVHIMENIIHVIIGRTLAVKHLPSAKTLRSDPNPNTEDMAIVKKRYSLRSK